MRKLNPDINAVIRKFGAANGNFVESLTRALPIMSVLLTAIITIGTILSGLDDSSDTGGGTDEPPIIAPAEPVANEEMRTGLLRAINYYRSQQGNQPASFDIALHANAQRQAVENARSGGFLTLNSQEQRILMLQAREDTSIASVDSFMAGWMKDGANSNAMMHPGNEELGIGIAELNGQTFAVVQFTQQ